MRSVPIPHLYRSLHEYLMQRIPDECETRLTNLIFLMMGIFQSRSVQLNLVARKTPSRAQTWDIGYTADPNPRSGAFWINFGGPSWSQYVECSDPTDASILLGTSNPPPSLALRKACLYEYRGTIFAAIYHETSFNVFIDTNQLEQLLLEEGLAVQYPNVDDDVEAFSYSNGDIRYSYDVRYLYAHAAVNGLLNTAAVRTNQNPATYIHNFSCTSATRVCQGHGPTGPELGNNPAWIEEIGWDVNIDGPECDEYHIDEYAGQSVRWCVDRDWYNLILDRWGHDNINHPDWVRGYMDIMPGIITAIHDELIGIDPLSDGQFSRSANHGIYDNNDRLIDTVDYLTVLYPSNNESISDVYMTHLNNLYRAAAAQCIIPIQVAPEYIANDPSADQRLSYPLRATNNGEPHTSPPYPTTFGNPHSTEFGLTADSIHIHYVRVARDSFGNINALTWETAVFQFGIPIADGIRFTSYPANPALWRGQVWTTNGIISTLPNVFFELIIPSNSQCVS